MGWFSRKKQENPGEQSGLVSDSPQREIAQRFDQLVERAQAAGGGAAYGAVWAAAVELPAWVFVGTPTAPDRPYRGAVNSEPAVFAFTDEFNARKFAITERLQLPDGAVALLWVPVEKAMDLLIEAHDSDGVVRAVFNAESNYFVGFLKDFRMLKAKWQETCDRARDVERKLDPSDEPRRDVPNRPRRNASVTSQSQPRFQDTFTQLAADARAMGTREAVNRLWKATFELDRWHFIHQTPRDGESPDGPVPLGWPRPVTARVDGKLYVLAFTTSDRALACAVRNNLAPPESAIPLLEMSRDSAAELLCQMDDRQVDGVLFNHNEGEHGFYADLWSVASLYEWHLDRLPPKMFDAFVKSVTKSNSAQAWAQMNRRLAKLDQWIFIGDKERPQAPQLYNYDGEIVALVFTDADHAARGATMMGGADSQGRVPLIPDRPAGAAAYLKQLNGHTEGKVHDALFNLGSQPFLVPISDLEKLIELK